MKHPGLFLSAPLSLALVGALLAASTLAMAQPSPAADAHARYEQERQKCMTNNTQDSLATCLREVQHTANSVEARRLVAAFDAELVTLADEYAARREWPDTDAQLAALGVVVDRDEVRLVDVPMSGVRDAIMRR